MTEHKASRSKSIRFFSLFDQERSYECSSSSTLTFCFARPSRSTQKQTSNPTKLQRHRYSPPVRAAADSTCSWTWWETAAFTLTPQTNLVCRLENVNSAFRGMFRRALRKLIELLVQLKSLIFFHRWAYPLIHLLIINFVISLLYFVDNNFMLYSINNKLIVILCVCWFHPGFIWASETGCLCSNRLLQGRAAGCYVTCSKKKTAKMIIRFPRLSGPWPNLSSSLFTH